MSAKLTPGQRKGRSANTSIAQAKRADARARAERTQHTPGPVTLRISATIENEYANRAPDFLPLDKLNVGPCALTLDEAHAVLADAEHNCDRAAVDVGPYGTPLPVFNAYAALAKQARAAIAKATGAGAMTAHKTTRGGTREGAGRKPIADGVESVVVPVRCSPEQKAKFHALGGAEWFRRMLNRAKLSTR